MEFDLENPLTSFREHQEDTIPTLFANESNHMPSFPSQDNNEFLASVRCEAISLILEAQFSYNLDPFVSYLAVNYMDRFISKQEIPREQKPWFAKLLAICCLSLAAKIKNIDLPLSDLQRDVGGFVYAAQSIHRMEMLILTTLNWRMRSITPFSFLYFFVSLLELPDPSLSHNLKHRASEIIFKSHYEIELLEYKPSIIAASALLCACHELFRLQISCYRAAISSCGYLNKENLERCLSGMREIVMLSEESTVDALSGSTKTAASVVDCQCSTNTGSEITTTSNTTARDSGNIKRRKLNPAAIACSKVQL